MDQARKEGKRITKGEKIKCILRNQGHFRREGGRAQGCKKKHKEGNGGDRDSGIPLVNWLRWDSGGTKERGGGNKC